MATLIESPRVAFVSGSSLPGALPISLSRLILPFLCVSIGVSVGTATGLTLALVNAPNNAMAASSDSTQTDPTTSNTPAVNVAMNASPAPIVQPTVAAPLAAIPSQPAALSAPSHSPAVSMTVKSPKTVETRPYLPRLAATSKTTPKVEVALNKAPDALRPATFKLGGKEYHVAKLISLPIAKPEIPEATAEPPAAPTALNPAQWSLDTTKPASVYTEGDLTVTEYDATAGTVQTSDGRTFVLGTTVASGNATGWETYRSDVHYRCDQNGSCVLMRAGIVAPNARLI